MYLCINAAIVMYIFDKPIFFKKLLHKNVTIKTKNEQIGLCDLKREICV